MNARENRLNRRRSRLAEQVADQANHTIGVLRRELSGQKLLIRQGVRFMKILIRDMKTAKKNAKSRLISAFRLTQFAEKRAQIAEDQAKRRDTALREAREELASARRDRDRLQLLVSEGRLSLARAISEVAEKTVELTAARAQIVDKEIEIYAANEQLRRLPEAEARLEELERKINN